MYIEKLKQSIISKISHFVRSFVMSRKVETIVSKIYRNPRKHWFHFAYTRRTRNGQLVPLYVQEMYEMYLLKIMLYVKRFHFAYDIFLDIFNENWTTSVRYLLMMVPLCVRPKACTFFSRMVPLCVRQYKSHKQEMM